MPLTTTGSFLIQSAGRGDPENPFVPSLNNTVIMRIDGCEVHPIFDGGEFRGYYFRYLWRGKLIFEDILKSDSPTKVFTLANCEIRFRISKSTYSTERLWG